MSKSVANSHVTGGRNRVAVTWIAVLGALVSVTQAAPAPPSNVVVADHPWDGGSELDVTFERSTDDNLSTDENPVVEYVVEQSGEFIGVYQEVARVATASLEDRQTRSTDDRPTATVTIPDVLPGEPYWYRVVAIGLDGDRSVPANSAEDAPGIATRQAFDGTRFWLLVIGSVICGSVVLFIGMARAGRSLYIRKIAGLEAVEEAVGRATEMGRSCLFIPGIQDINDIQTIAGLTILSRVAQRAAEYDASLEVPTARSLVMTAARETVQAAYLTAGRPDAYNEDTISYITDEQFGYVAYLSGVMVREKPAACFYLGAFFAESLILAETGNAIGAIQVAGTAQPAQLPFFVAACDYTLIGEEFFAASAYLSHDPDQLGSLKGQDVGKLIVAGLMVVGVGLLTWAGMADSDMAQQAADYVRNVMLASG